MIFIHIIIPILVGAYLYYTLVYKKKTEKFTNTSEEQEETEEAEENNNSTVSETVVPTSNSAIPSYLNSQFKSTGLNFRSLSNCETFTEEEIDYCISKDLGDINEHTSETDISTGSAIFLKSDLVISLPTEEYIYLIFPGTQPSACYYPQKADGPGCGQYQRCGETNPANIANYYLNGNKCRIDQDTGSKTLFEETYQIISDGNAGSKINQNELVWSNSTDVLAIGYLNDLKNPLTYIELQKYKDKAVLMQTMIKNDSSLNKRTIPVVQIKLNTDNTITFVNYDDISS